MNGPDLTILGLGLMLNFAQLYNPDHPMVTNLIYLMDPMAETEPVLDGFSPTQYVHPLHNCTPTLDKNAHGGFFKPLFSHLVTQWPTPKEKYPFARICANIHNRQPSLLHSCLPMVEYL
jgi:hypothetical protein